MQPIKCCLNDISLSRLAIVLILKRNIHVYETDLMGIVHHSNYLRLCEEARVEWCRKIGGLGLDDKEVFGLTVVETRVRHHKPARYADVVEIEIQSKIEGVRIFFQYKIRVARQVVCTAETVHCNIDINFKVKRLNPELIKKVEKEVWTETWL